MIKVLFVCLGNICRSPTAEGVFRKLIQEQGYVDRILTDSAGTHAYHVGEPPDERAQATAALRDIDISQSRGRMATVSDIEEFDYILAMDRENLLHLRKIGPPQMRHKIELLLKYLPHRREQDVPDPYFGGASGFDRVLDMIEEAAHGLLNEIRNRYKL